MARIRIVDTWLRSPASPPSHHRSIMVVAEKWAEQRVLLRAFADCRDQSLPTILLQGIELAIGPAGVDAQGPWGIHAREPGEGHAQAIRDALEAAARRLAGSRGNPPRLLDESATFDREPTANWEPGAPAILPGGRGRADRVAVAGAERVQPLAAAPVPPPRAERFPAGGAAAPGPAPPPPVRPRTLTPARAGSAAGARTALGYASGGGAQSAVVRLGLSPAVSARLGRLADRLLPAEFELTRSERQALNALGEQGAVSARALGQLVEVGDGVAFMEHLVEKLERHGLDLIEPGDPRGNEPTYRLRR